MDKVKLDNIKWLLIKRVFRNSDIVFSDEIRTGAGSDIDLLSLIASLLNLLIKECTGDDYEYFFHWTNKVGGWVEDDYIDQLLEGWQDGKGKES